MNYDYHNVIKKNSLLTLKYLIFHFIFCAVQHAGTHKIGKKNIVKYDINIILLRKSNIVLLYCPSLGGLGKNGEKPIQIYEYNENQALLSTNGSQKLTKPEPYLDILTELLPPFPTPSVNKMYTFFANKKYILQNYPIPIF